MRRALTALTALLLLAAACQPQSRRLLLLDLTLGDPLVVAATAAPWDAAGYAVEYRRFYPHLTRQDLTRYRAVIVLTGREPETPSDALTVGDLAVLMEWLHGGRVVVVGYAGDGDGSRDRWVLNQWLAALGAGLTIEDHPLEDSVAPGGGPPRVSPDPQSALDRAGFQEFPAGRNHGLIVRRPGQILARASASAFVRPPREAPATRPAVPVIAASRVGGGLLVVASRHALAATGADVRPNTLPTAVPAEELTRVRLFLEALARWTRRPAEWATVAPAEDGIPLELSGPARPVAIHPPALAPPPGATVTPLPGRAAADGGARREVPAWIARQGMRGLWSRWPYRGVDSLLTFLDVGGFNVWATAVPISALHDSLRSRVAWRVLADRLQVTSLRWFPSLALAELRPAPAPALERNPELDLRGNPVPSWCGLDETLWRAMLRPAFRTLARLGSGQGEPVAGVALDLDLPAGGYGAAGFCDATYHEGLRALGLDSTAIAVLRELPAAARYDALLERGLLEGYYEALERAVARRAVALRAELSALGPELRFAFRSSLVPADWFSLGLLRGLSSVEAPALLWTRERRTRELLEGYGARGIVLLSALTITPDRVAPRDWLRLRRLAFGEHDGFVLLGTETGPGVGADSLARLIRRLAR